jgi:16S rRNA A1518/A1519 N6-dimethyltransferase RsmA/KsgA/DIM1 with predicted DNA glycosylase/AP lyase activity
MELGTMSNKKEFGDYQTPEEFALSVCVYIKEKYNVSPTAVIEPTCGIGNFLNSSLIFNAKEYYGIEINKEYYNYCNDRFSDDRVKIINSDFFGFNSNELIKDRSSVLIIGNPPWVTNSNLSALNSKNLPPKMNFKRFKGIDAITGSSNFDICEYIIHQLLNEYRNTDTLIVMLCKTSVARNIFKEIKQNNFNLDLYELLEFDAMKVFGISASACILLIRLTKNKMTVDFANIRNFSAPETIVSSFSYEKNKFHNNINNMIDDFDGFCCFEWRQGVKHDCSKIMELTLNNEKLLNGFKEEVYIEKSNLFPLVKSSHFKSPVLDRFLKYVIVTQKKAGEETAYLQEVAPKTWDYLQKNYLLFEKRKSSIYKGAPKFSMFGIGDYSYFRYKVGISGFYKQPIFSLLYSKDDKPVMTDDTSYFIPFDSYEMAYISMIILNNKRVQEFLLNISFLNSKRPYTKKVLERLDFGKILEKLTYKELLDTESTLKLRNTITKKLYEEFRCLVDIKGNSGYLTLFDI